MYINFWYPVILSEELKDEPVKVRMLGQNFVTFRDSKGAPKTLSDTCFIEADHYPAVLSEVIASNAHITDGDLMVKENAKEYLH